MTARNNCKLWILPAVLLTLAGCVSQGPDTRYTRDGKAYGVTGGTFRGRWWNYYERGRSFGDGGFWAEAERDFRAALAGRSRDQLWPRTYGLHFIPEYFPRRELGVALHQQGRFEEAVAELERSLADLHSARAAFYLDEARRAIVHRDNTDRDAPSISLFLPDHDLPLSGTMIAMEGVAADDTFVTSVRVNGEPVAVPVSGREVRFSTDVALSAGANTIRIEATDITGKGHEKVLFIAADPDGPAVGIDAPVVFPGRVTGVVTDPSGVTSLRLAGQDIPLGPADGAGLRFETEVTPEMVRDAREPLVLEAEDALGNVTRLRLSPDAVADASALTDTMPAASGGWEPVGDGRMALRVGDRYIVLANTQPQPDGLAVRFASLREGQRYLMDEVVVTVETLGDAPVADVTLDGIPLQPVPGRAAQTLSRRVRLSDGPNVFEAVARDRQGREARATVTVDRAPTAIEALANRLSVALLGNLWRGNGPALAGEQDHILGELEGGLGSLGRFRLVDRALLPEVLGEQQLGALLGSGEARLEMGRTVPADLALVGRAWRDHDSIELVVEAVSTDTALFVARSDVAGRADTLEELDELVSLLALRIAQDFPRAGGSVEPPGAREEVALPAPLPVLAVPESAWIANSPGHVALAERVVASLEGAVMRSDTFGLADRDSLPELEIERLLDIRENGSTEGISLVPAAFLITGGIRPDDDGGLTLWAEAVDTATTAVVARAGQPLAADTPDAAAITAEGLADAILAALPQASSVPLGKGPRIRSSLARADGVRPSMKCVVYREGAPVLDPISGNELGRETEIIGEAVLESVADNGSSAALVRALPGTIRRGDLILVK
jgi:hypothetical protein